MPELMLDASGIEAFLREYFPPALEAGPRITRCDSDGLELTLVTEDRHLRPGGTVSGPTLMSMADAASYFVILSRIGTGHTAVTSSLDIHFLRRPRPGQIVAEATVLKLGRRVAVVSVSFSGPPDTGPIAISTVTYAISA